MKKNQKGFTLVEIIISLAVASVVLMIAAAMIISSFGFLNETVARDSDKRCLDSIMEYVRGEILYSSDVRIVKDDYEFVPDMDEEGDWHYFYVQEGRLYRDDVKLFDENFYSQRDFHLNVKGDYENNKRVDIQYRLTHRQEEVYKTRDTVMFLNLTANEEIQKQALYTSDYIDLSQSQYKLYYNKDYMPQEEEDDGSQGTVADQIEFLKIQNDRGRWTDDVKERFIHKFDFVFVDGYWWMSVTGSSNYSLANGPGKTLWWKRISATWSESSAYQKDDIIIYKGKYYKCLLDIINAGQTGVAPDDPAIKIYWREVSRANVWEDGAAHIRDKVVYNQDYNKTIISKLSHIKLEKVKEYKEAENASIPIVSNPLQPRQNEVFKMTEKDATTQQVFTRYFIKVYQNGTKPDETVNGKNGWQQLCIDFSETSVYLQNDIVFCAREGQKFYIQALHNMDYVTVPEMDISQKINWRDINK